MISWVFSIGHAVGLTHGPWSSSEGLLGALKCSVYTICMLVQNHILENLMPDGRYLLELQSQITAILCYHRSATPLK